MTMTSMTSTGDGDDNRLLRTNLIHNSPDCPSACQKTTPHIGFLSKPADAMAKRWGSF